MEYGAIGKVLDGNEGGGLLDFSECTAMTSIDLRYTHHHVKLPSSINKTMIDNVYSNIDFQNVPSTKVLSGMSFCNKIDLSNMKNFNCSTNNLSCWNISGEPKISNFSAYIPKTKSFSLSWSRTNCYLDCDGVQNFIGLDTLYLNFYQNATTLNNINKISLCSSLNWIQISNATCLTSLSFVSTLTGLTTFKISNSGVSSISPLANLKSLTTLHLFGGSYSGITDLTPLTLATNSEGKIGYTSLDVSNNPLGGDNASKNINALIALKGAGLQSINVTGCGFTVPEINSLKASFGNNVTN